MAYSCISTLPNFLISLAWQRWHTLISVSLLCSQQPLHHFIIVPDRDIFVGGGYKANAQAVAAAAVWGCDPFGNYQH